MLSDTGLMVKGHHC